MVAALAVLLVAAPPAAGPGQGQSVGKPWSGRLENGVPMPLTGEHHRFTWVARKKGTNYGTRDIVSLLARAAATVDHFVSSPPLVLGSISANHGGKLGSHKSHQTGRDVDILFYVVDPKGRRKAARGFHHFDGDGRCQEKACAGWAFDVQANWWLARTLLWSKSPQVQYIFVSNPLKRLMLDYARRRGEHPEILRRAALVMTEPGNSSPHADHFHVRIYCSKADRSAGCTDGAPRWDWVR